VSFGFAFSLMMSCTTYFCVAVTKIPEKQVKEEGFVLVHGFIRFSPWLLGPMLLSQNIMIKEHVAEELLHLMVDRKQREQGLEDHV
jgi:hypothetical protein